MISPYRSTIVCVMLLVLAVMALSRLEFATSEGANREELIVYLSLEQAGDLDEITRSAVVAIESAIRSVCNANRVSGFVHDKGAWLRITLAEGVDSTAKAARLLSELEHLREQLPDSARLHVYEWGEGATGEFMLILMRGESRRNAVLEVRHSLLKIPGVREARLVGIDRPAVNVRLKPATLPEAAEAISAMTKDGTTAPALGTIRSADHEVALFGESERGPLEDRSLFFGERYVTVAELAEVSYGQGQARNELRIDGEPTAGVILYREANADLFDLERDVRKTAASIEHETGIVLEIVRSDAEEITLILRRWFAGLIAASVLLGLIGSFWGPGKWGAISTGSPLIPWVSASGSILALFLTGRSADADRLVIIIIASTLGIVFGMLIQRDAWASRVRWLIIWIASIATIPLVIEVISSVGLVEISADALVFVTAAAGAATALLAAPRGPALVAGKRFTYRYRKILSEPATTLLGVGSALFVLFSLFGDALDPRNEAPILRTDSLTATIEFPEDGTIERAGELVKQAEEELQAIEGIERLLVSYDQSSAVFHLELDPDNRRRDSWSRISLEAQYRLGDRGFGVTLGPVRDDSGTVAGAEEKTEPSADAAALSYRAILRSSSAVAMRTAIGRIRDRAPSADLAASQIRIEGETLRPRLEAIPRTDTPPEVLAELARVIRASPGQISSIPLMDDSDGEIIIRPYWADPNRPQLRQVTETFDQPTRFGDGATSLAHWTELRETYRPVSMPREDGQFVQVLTVRFPGHAEWRRTTSRDQFHGLLRGLPLPQGVDLVQPVLERSHFNERRLRMIGLLVLTPLFFWACGAIVLNRVAFEPVAAIMPPIAGVAAGATYLRFASIELSALAILALLSVSAVSLFCSIVLLDKGLGKPGQPLTISRAYRAARMLFAPLTAGTAACIVIVAALIFDLDSARYSWVNVLILTAISGGAAMIAAAVVPASALLLLVDVRKLPEILDRRREKSTLWQDDGTPATLAVRSLTKIYPNGHQALNSVSFDLEPSIVALLGPNGAGKSTLIRVLTGLLQPTRGEMYFKGSIVESGDLPAYRRMIGYLPQEFNAYPHFSAEQFLDYWAIEIGMNDRVRRREEVGQILVAVGLDEHADRKVRDFSGGMRQRIGIARSLLGSPPVIIVDEPTTGLDIESRQRLRATLRSIAVHRIVILSTHIASDVEGTASRILLLNQGSLQFDGTPAQLTQRAAGRSFETMADDEELHRLTREYRITARVRTIDGIRVRGVSMADQPLPGDPVAPNLEEGYLALIADTSGGRSDRGLHYAWIRDLFQSS